MLEIVEDERPCLPILEVTEGLQNARKPADGAMQGKWPSD